MINSKTSAWIHPQKFTMSHLNDMWMLRKKMHKRDSKGLLLRELNQRKYGFLNPSLKKCTLKHPKKKKNLKLYGFPSLFWKTWIFRILQSWHWSFQRLPLHLLPKFLHHLIHLNLKLFHPWFLHHSNTLQGVCQCWSCPLFPLPFHIPFNTLSTPPSILPLLSFHPIYLIHSLKPYPPYIFSTISLPLPYQHLWAYLAIVYV